MRVVGFLCSFVHFSYSVRCTRFTAVYDIGLWQIEKSLKDCTGYSCSIELGKRDGKIRFESSCNNVTQNGTGLEPQFSCITEQYRSTRDLYFFECTCFEDYCTIPILLQQFRNEERVLETAFGPIENDRTDLLIRSC